MEIYEQTWLLIARSLSGEATAAEIEALNQLLHKNPRLQQQYDMLLRIWHSNKAGELANAQHETDKAAIARIIHKAEETEKKAKTLSLPALYKWKRLAPVAAAIILAIIVSGWFLYQKPNKPAMTAIPALVTEKGKKIKSVLPDGSIVWLNGDSKIYYENDFRGATREVKLVGEAFFDIVKKTGQPFIVHANNINIKVLGTAFNVKAYANDKTVETSLFRGLVNITKNDDKSFQPILLKPNQKIVLPIGYTTEKTISPLAGSLIEAAPIAIEQLDSTLAENNHIETAWLNNRLEFRGENFAELALRLERWYNVKIIFENEEVKRLSFNGSFENETIVQALNALKIANSFNYKIKDHEIFISSAK